MCGEPSLLRGLIGHYYTLNVINQIKWAQWNMKIAIHQMQYDKPEQNTKF